MPKPYETSGDQDLLTKAFMSNDAIRHLVAAEPAHGLKEKLATFGHLIGSWDLVMNAIAEDGSRTEFIAEWHFGWVLQGRVIQDVLITRTPDGELAGYGTTVRTYDDRDGKWWVVWQDPVAHEFAVLIARPSGDGIELDGQWPRRSGVKFRWAFSAIGPSAFHWEAFVSEDDGATWRLGEVMDAVRRAPEEQERMVGARSNTG